MRIKSYLCLRKRKPVQKMNGNTESDAGLLVLFEDYRITVAAPIREYSIDDRRHAPDDSNAFLKSE